MSSVRGVREAGHKTSKVSPPESRFVMGATLAVLLEARAPRPVSRCEYAHGLPSGLGQVADPAWRHGEIPSGACRKPFAFTSVHPASLCRMSRSSRRPPSVPTRVDGRRRRKKRAWLICDGRQCCVTMAAPYPCAPFLQPQPRQPSGVNVTSESDLGLCLSLPRLPSVRLYRSVDTPRWGGDSPLAV